VPSALRPEATVLPGHRLEVTAPELPEGARVEVIIVLPAVDVRSPGRTAARSEPPVLPELGGVRKASAAGEGRVGTLSLPASGLVYVDANPIIYTVESHPVYGPPS